ncbi:hypothetical protein FHS11_001273 [Mucilaginibacter gotjawali]|uniref:Uncharacterized protein n=1 Tax=Mucilaginibacter gotjawali TaxID=1550579 RepID=A0A839SAL5_9SPHI|nr:hypothetical protein [Mucilaginibacter gotjawali]
MRVIVFSKNAGDGYCFHSDFGFGIYSAFGVAYCFLF